MDDATVKRKMNQIVKLSRELEAEAQRRWGEAAFLFVEADGGMHLMSGDACPDAGSIADRQAFIEISADGIHRLGCGAW